MVQGVTLKEVNNALITVLRMIDHNYTFDYQPMSDHTIYVIKKNGAWVGEIEVEPDHNDQPVVRFPRTSDDLRDEWLRYAVKFILPEIDRQLSAKRLQPAESVLRETKILANDVLYQSHKVGNAIADFARYEVQAPLEMQHCGWWGEYAWDVLYTGNLIGHIRFTPKSSDLWLIDQVYVTREATTRANLDEIGNALVKRLSQQGLIGGSTTPEAPQPAETSADNTPQAEVWERIPDRKWDRLAVKLLYEGHTSPEIATKIGRIIAKTVDNRLSELRSQFDFIETREEIERKKRDKRKS